MTDKINKLLAEKKQKESEKENEIYNKWYKKYGESLKIDIINSLGNGQDYDIYFKDIELTEWNCKFYMVKFLENEKIRCKMIYHPDAGFAYGLEFSLGK